MPPVCLTSAYAQESPGVHQGFEYTRSHNPTRYAAERCVAAFEGSTLTTDDDASCGGFAFASGLAAIGTVLDMLSAGDHVVAMDDLYGGTGRPFRQVKERSQNLSFSFVDMTDLDALESSITDSTRTDLGRDADQSDVETGRSLRHRSHGQGTRHPLRMRQHVLLPMLQQPIRMGFDFVMHSGTKYLGGHSDVVGGFLVAATSGTGRTHAIQHQNSIGSILGPFDSYLMLRGMKTLAIRMRSSPADPPGRIAEHLEGGNGVGTVIYPGLTSHPQHELAARQMQIDGALAGGGMISVVLDTDLPGTRRFLEALRVFTLAESLGGVESLVNHPAIMTHASVPAEHQAARHHRLARSPVRGHRGGGGSHRRHRLGPGCGLGFIHATARTRSCRMSDDRIGSSGRPRLNADRRGTHHP